MIIPAHHLTQTKTGFGLVADQPIKKGQLVWKHSPQHEFRLPLKLFQSITQYGYRDGNDVVVDLDESKFFNHSCSPNVVDSGDDCIAVRDIIQGDELTWDYTITSLKDFECKCGSKNCRQKIKVIPPQLVRPWHCISAKLCLGVA